MIKKPAPPPNPAQEIRQLVMELVKRQRLDLASISKRIGKNHAYLQQYIKRGVPHILPEEVRPPLARLLGCRADDLRPAFTGEWGGEMEGLANETAEKLQAPMQGIGNTLSPVAVMGNAPRNAPGNILPAQANQPANQPASPNNLVRMSAPDQRGGERRLPVFGAAKGGWDGSLVDWENPAEWLPVPPELLGVNEAFAMFVTGDSMEPRYSHGDMVYCHPSRPATRGCYVVVVKKTGDTLIKQFIRAQNTSVELHQFNPEGTIKLPLTDITHIYRIVGQWERG